MRNERAPEPEMPSFGLMIGCDPADFVFASTRASSTSTAAQRAKRTAPANRPTRVLEGVQPGSRSSGRLDTTGRPTRSDLGGTTRSQRVISAAPARLDRPGKPLGRRARLGAIAATVLVMVGGYGVANAANESQSVRHYIVQPGDTLWGIARAQKPTGDIRKLVAQLSSAHGGADIAAGDVLEIPRG
jgi:LysM repeat protein